MSKIKIFDVRNGVKGLVCNKCITWKPKDSYSKSTPTKLGVRGQCRECCNKEKQEWYKSIKGVIYTIYSSQKDSCKNRQMSLPSYTRDWFYNWCINQELFHKLYNEWVKSGYNKYKKPSVDREDNLKSYSEDNIRLMTWGENEKLAQKGLREGTTRYNHTAVYKQDLDGNILESYFGITEAGRKNDMPYENIQKVCKRERYTAGGFFWSFQEGFNLEDSKTYIMLKDKK